MSKDKTDLIIRINSGTDIDKEELEKRTQQLREQILDLNVDSVDLVKTRDKPEGSKAGEEVLTWGSLVVSLAASGGVLPSLIGTIQSWLSGRQNRENQKISMEIDGDKIELSGISSDEQRRLIDLFISRHSKKGRSRNA
jgi:hypothetical protein